MKDLRTRIIEKVSKGELTKEFAFELIKGLQKPKEHEDIAVIGMAGKFPSAHNLEEFWLNLKNGLCTIAPFPENRRKDTDLYLSTEGSEDPYLKGGYLEDIDLLDAEFFRLSPKEAQLMDPYQRIFLETAWEAIEDAGYGGDALNGTKTGLYVGRDFSDGSFYKEMMTEPNPLAVTGLATSILASRLAYILNLHGPAVVIDTACSSSLVALHMAAQSLETGECDAAIVGGIALSLFPAANVGVGVDSADATVRAFDKGANGTVWGEGAGAIVIKPLKKAQRDGDRIYAVIKGSAINNDGASNGLVAPRAEAQEDVIIKAWEKAQIHPESLSYIEAHGTGTQLGDPIEVKGLVGAFQRYTTNKQFCLIGSLKPNIGHLVGASGIASVIKVILAMVNQEIPASLNFEEPNPHIDFLNSPLAVNNRLTPWQTGSTPRRAGVTSLGFSGTNCHVVLEEYNIQTKEPVEEVGVNLLALSANSKTALQQLVLSYCNWLEKRKDISLNAMCSTANTGRGHYRHRLALIFTNHAQLLQLLRTVGEGLVEGEADGIYYASHRVVGFTDAAGPGDLSEGERVHISTQAAKLLDEIKAEESNKPETIPLLQELARLYVKGADIKWSDLYTERQKIKVPGYPFERKRHWIQAKPKLQLKSAAPLLPEGEEPLFDQILVMPDQTVNLTGFNVKKHWVLSEHRIMGMCIVPGTTYLEMLLEQAKVRADQMVEVDNLTFISPLVVADEETKVAQTVIMMQNDQYTFNVQSQHIGPGGESQWLKHAMAKYRLLPTHGPRKVYNLTEIQSRCPELRIIPDENYDIKGIYEMGPRWRNIRQVYVGTNEVIGYLELAPEYITDLAKYRNHPALMDMAVGVASQIVENSREYLPFSYKKIRLYESLPAKCYSYARKKENLANRTETIAFDIILMDEQGRVLLEIDEYMIKKVNKAELKAISSEPLYYQIFWKEQILADAQSAVSTTPTLIFADGLGVGAGLAEALKQNGTPIITVEEGDTYTRLNNNHYKIQTTPEDYAKLLHEIASEQKLAKIVYCFSVQGKKGVEDLAELEEVQKRGVYSLFHLAKALVNLRSSDSLELFLLTDWADEVTGREEELHPESAALISLGKVIGQEYPKLKTRAIDIDWNLDTTTLLKEMSTLDAPYQVAYREGQRYIPEIGRTDLSKIQEHELIWREGGVYLITGGMGGLGLEFGKDLARRVPQVKLALVGRTPLPLRSEWGVNHDSKFQKTIEAIQEMEKAGAVVHCYSGDVANIQQMSAVFNDLRKHYGQIHGIIHAAGVAGEGLLVNKDISTYTSVLRPKIEGTWVLDHLTAEDKPEIFILFSSLNAVLGGPGQSDYAAANAYMDSFAARRNRQGKRTLSIKWPAWRETGMAVRYGVNLDGGVFKAIAVQSGLEALQHVAAKQIHRMAIGELNYDLLLQLPAALPIGFSAEIAQNLLVRKRQLNQKSAQTLNVVIKEESDQLTDTDRKLANIWGNALGLEEVSLHDNFYDLGGDSIIAITIATKISEEFKIEFPLEEIFNHPTIDGISKVLPNLTSAVKFKKVERRRISL